MIGRRSSSSTDNSCQWVCHSHQQIGMWMKQHSLRKMKRISISDLHKYPQFNCRDDCVVFHTFVWKWNMWNSRIQVLCLEQTRETKPNSKQKCFIMLNWSNKKLDSIFFSSCHSFEVIFYVNVGVLQVVNSTHLFVFVSIHEHINLNRTYKHWTS